MCTCAVSSDRFFHADIPHRKLLVRETRRRERTSCHCAPCVPWRLTPRWKANTSPGYIKRYDIFEICRRALKYTEIHINVLLYLGEEQLPSICLLLVVGWSWSLLLPLTRKTGSSINIYYRRIWSFFIYPLLYFADMVCFTSREFLPSMEFNFI